MNPHTFNDGPTLLTHHDDINCDGCGVQSFTGKRYQCTNKRCIYNLCEVCYKNPPVCTSPPPHRTHRKNHTEFHSLTGDQTYQRHFQRYMKNKIQDEFDFSDSATMVIIRFMDRLVEYMMDWNNEGIQRAVVNIISPAPSSSSSSLANEPLPSPCFLLPQIHPHPLQLYRLIHHSTGISGYRCDLCHHKGFELAYSCAECQFDLHPVCFKESGGCDPNPQSSPNHPRIQAPVAMDVLGETITDFADRIDFYIPSLQNLLQNSDLSEFVEHSRLSALHFRKNDNASFLSIGVFSASIERYYLRRQIPPADQLQFTRTELGAFCGIVSGFIHKLVHAAKWMARKSFTGIIRPINFFSGIYALEDHEALKALCTFLNSPFTIESTQPNETTSSANWNSLTSFPIPPSHSFPRTTPFEIMLDYTFRPNVELLQELNSHEWYFDSIKVKQYACEYAHLRLPPGDSYFYRLYGITPIAYYGSIRNGLVARLEGDETSFHDDSVMNDSNYRCFTFRFNHPKTNEPIILAMDMTYQLGHPDPKSPVSEILFKWINTATAEIMNEWRVETPIKTKSKSKSKPNSNPSASTPSTTSAMNLREAKSETHEEEEESKMEIGDSTTTTATTPTITSRHVEFAIQSPRKPTSSVWTTQLLKCIEIANQLFIEQHSHPDHPVVQDPKRLRMPYQMIATQLCLFEDYPTHVWEANHPLSVRHYFTQELIREQSRLVGLPDLPNDLLHLIGEYEPAYLPSPTADDEVEMVGQSRYQARVEFAKRGIDDSL